VPDTSGSVDLSATARTPEEEEALRSLQNGERPAEEPKDGVEDILTLFLVVVGLDGNPTPMAVKDPRYNPLVELTADYIYGAVQTIAKDISAMEAARVTADVMQQQAMALQQQMQDQMLQRQVAAGLKTGPR
jgi:hypothetical protein